MILGAIFKLNEEYVCVSETFFPVPKILRDLYKPLYHVIEDSIEEAMAKDTPECVLFQSTPDKIWMYNIRAKPDGWSWADVIKLVNEGKMMVVRPEFAAEMKEIDLGMNEHELAKRRLEEFCKSVDVNKDGPQ